MDGAADGGNRARRAEKAEQAIIAAAAGDCLLAAQGFDLKHETGVVFEVAAELGREDRVVESDAGRFKASEAAVKRIERGPKVDAGPLGDQSDAVGGLFRGRPDVKVSIDDGRDLARQRRGTEIGSGWDPQWHQPTESERLPESGRPCASR